MRNNLSAWTVSEDHFPSFGSIKEKFKFFVRYAILAPSGHNTQPWVFEVHEESLNLYADRTRALPVIDPDDRELIISCGAALTNLIVTMKYFGFEPEIIYFPSDSDNDLLATIKVKARDYQPTDADKIYFKAIPNRRTNRLPFAEEIIDGITLQKLMAAANDDKDVRFSVVEAGGLREEMTKMIELGDRTQSQNKSFCRELAQWVHPNRTSSKDGIPGYAFGMGDLISYGSPFFIGNLNWGDIQAGRDRNLVKGSPVLGVLESKDNKPIDWLKTGMTLSKLLLRACSEGIAASYLNQPLEVPELFDKLRELINTNYYPQMIIRLGYGKEVKSTPRRDVEDVIKLV
ncbi:MAG: nitroreductase [Ignavibacteria bacterium]|nr:nitroreductase [Ignavibacteria bacterium]